MLPEVVSLTKSDDLLRRNSYFLCPDIKRFLVVLIDRGIKKLCGYLHPLGQKFPCPCDSLVLEVISEREVTEHLKVSTVTCGLSNSLKVGSTDTTLTRGNAAARRLLLTCEVLFHRSHARVYEQKALVVYRYERKARKSEVSLRLKKGEILFSALIK